MTPPSDGDLAGRERRTRARPVGFGGPDNVGIGAGQQAPVPSAGA